MHVIYAAGHLKNYARYLNFVRYHSVLLVLVDFTHILWGLSLQLGQSDDSPSASERSRKNMGIGIARILSKLSFDSILQCLALVRGLCRM